MTAREQGFLLLTGYLGDPDRRPLTVAQFRRLAQLVSVMEAPAQERDLAVEDLVKIGCAPAFADRVLCLLQQQEQLQWYLQEGRKADCYPITRISEVYPARLRKALHLDAPGTLWAKGDQTILSNPCISAVGSRELHEENRHFAEELGKQAALQGYTLISGNARGADKVAQESCLANGGSVISVIADGLDKQTQRKNMLFISEEGFDLPFSAQRALQRNRIIHSLSSKTFVVQSGAGKGGTWSGTTSNLRYGWSDVVCFDDGSAASAQLKDMGAVLVGIEDLGKIERILPQAISFLEEI